MMSADARVWLALTSPLSAVSESVLTPDNRGLAYGDGFFTTMAVFDGAILWLDYHRQRLISHSQALQFDIDINKIITTLQLQAKQLQQGMLKLIITRAIQPIRGYGFSADKTGSACEIWLKAIAKARATSKQVGLPNNHNVFIQPTIKAICLSSQLACLPATLAGLKTLNRLDSVLASGELRAINAKHSSLDNDASQGANHWGEGLVRDMSGRWVEGTMSNVFYQLAKKPTHNKNHNANDEASANYLTTGQWYTPSMSRSGVAGVMRQVLIDALVETRHPVIIRPLKDQDLPKLSKLFFCNAVRGVMPVSALTLPNAKVVEFL